MKKQALTLAIAAALSAPSALAAQDTSGMHYTSASEGFYASIRARYHSGGHKDDGGDIQNSSSRIGVGGTNDLGGGLEGFYQWELGVNIDNGSPAGSVRVGRVGLRGAFGQVQAGSFWATSNDFVTGSTDVANVNSGNLVNTGYRVSKSLEYTSPNLNGFQGALRVGVSNERSSDCSVTVRDAATLGATTVPNADGDMGMASPAVARLVSCTGAVAKDDNGVDSWNLAAKYEVQGFTVGALYHRVSDDLAAVSAVTSVGDDNRYGGADANADTIVSKKKDDRNEWAVRLGYAQDNWYVNGWYGVSNAQSATAYNNGADNAPSASVAADHTDVANNDTPGKVNDEDVTNLSMAAGVTLDKVGLYAVWEQQKNAGGVDGTDKTYSTVGAQYNLGSQSKVWLEYAMQDFDNDKNAENYFTAGLQHNF